MFLHYGAFEEIDKVVLRNSVGTSAADDLPFTRTSTCMSQTHVHATFDRAQ
jgi:hypothetical protein